MKPYAIPLRGGLWMTHTPYGGPMYFGIGATLDEALSDLQDSIRKAYPGWYRSAQRS
jgi:hypothetical protein